MAKAKKTTRKTKPSKITVAKKVVKKTAVKKVVTKAPAKKAVVKKAAVKKVVAKKTVSKKTEPKKQAPKTRGKKTKKGQDTGSVEVQVDNFTVKIKSLIKHLKKHGHDNDSRRGLLIMVGKRRKLLNYVKKTEPKSYEKIIKKLKLKN